MIPECPYCHGTRTLVATQPYPLAYCRVCFSTIPECVKCNLPIGWTEKFVGIKGTSYNEIVPKKHKCIKNA